VMSHVLEWRETQKKEKEDTPEATSEK